MNQHGSRPLSRRTDGPPLGVNVKGIPVTALSDAQNHNHSTHDRDNRHDAAIGLGVGTVTGSGLGSNITTTTTTTTTKPANGVKHKKKGQRPTSLSLSVAGGWLQRGVKSLGSMSSWSSAGVGRRMGVPASAAGAGSGSGSAPRRSMQDGQTEPMREPGSMSSAPATHPHEIEVPQILQEGTWMTKVSGKKQKKMFLRLDPDIGHIIWHSKQPRIIPIENINEIRSGPSTRLHRHHFQLAQEYETLWLTIIYILDGHYKILHLIAPSEDIFRMWDTTLRRLHAYRLQLMTGLGNIEERQRVWEKQYWKGADMDRDQRLTFDEVEKMCRRLNINSPREDLLGWFLQADVQGRRYLDFEDFRRFVKFLKTRKEITLLFNHLKGTSEFFDFDVFAKFMRHDQKSTLPTPALLALFEKYSVAVSIPSSSSISASPPMTPHPTKDIHFDFRPSSGRSLSLPQRTFTPETLTTFLLSPDNAPFASPSHTSLPPKPLDPTSPLPSTTAMTATTTTTSSSLSSTKHDMTHPLCSYFISSSHNTYLVGHQLVGSSTVEGYIRALLAGCRSVEIDIFDGSGSNELGPPLDHDTSLSSSPNLTTGITGPGSGTSNVNSSPNPSISTINEPMVFHGHTLTTKVPLRQVCQAIMKYGFIASPYPIIISAENHCSIAGQEQIARIMIEEFGSALVRYPNDGPDLPSSSSSSSLNVATDGNSGSGSIEEGNWEGKAKITQLPSPEELRGRILLKTKNLMLGGKKLDRNAGSVASSESDMDFEFSSSASESDGLVRGLYRRDSGRKGGGTTKSGEGSGDLVRGGLGSMMKRVRSVGRSAAPSALSVALATSTSSTHTHSSTGMSISIQSSSNPSTPQNITQTTMVSSPPPLSPPLTSSKSLPITIPLSKAMPIPIQRQTSVPPPLPPPPYPSTSLPTVSNLSSSLKNSATIHESASTSGLVPYQASTVPLSSSNPSPSPVLSSSWSGGNGALSLVRRKSSQKRTPATPKPKMSMALVALLVYTVGVKCHGFRRSSHLYLHADENGSISDSKSTKSTKSKTKSMDGGVGDKEEELYSPEHMFSLSENSANGMLRMCMLDLIRHTEGHLVRVYPRGTRMRSTNFEPHRYWSAGAQLVAINWQTFDLGYIINHAMFQRNARCGYVLKPPPLRHPLKDEYSPEKWRKKSHVLSVTVISAQQLPRVKVKDGSGHEVLGSDRDKDGSGHDEGREKDGGSGGGGGGGGGGGSGKTVDPYVEVSLHVPEWTYCVSPSLPHTSSSTSTSTPALSASPSQQELPLRFTTSKPKTLTSRTPMIKNNGFNPIWNHTLRISFDCISQPGMLELIFIRFVVKQEGRQKDDAEPLAVCCVSLGELQQGYRHLPLYDATLSQYLFSTLFVKVGVN